MRAAKLQKQEAEIKMVKNSNTSAPGQTADSFVVNEAIQEESDNEESNDEAIEVVEKTPVPEKSAFEADEEEQQKDSHDEFMREFKQTQNKKQAQKKPKNTKTAVAPKVAAPI